MIDDARARASRRLSRLRGTAALLAATIVSLFLSQRLGAWAWSRKIEGLYAWVEAAKTATAPSLSELPSSPDRIHFGKASNGPPGLDSLILEYSPNSFMWLTHLVGVTSYDSYFVEVSSREGRLSLRVVHGSD